MASIAYVDPGNVAANLTSGASYGYLLVWVLVLANGMAMLIQYQSAKLGIVTGRTLPEHVGARTRPWTGGWLVVHSGPLARSDRARLKARQRALDMLGFRELDPGLWLRPDNIEDGVDAVRARLVKLGLEASAGVFVASQFDVARAKRIAKLWDGKALNASYAKLRRELESWMQRAAKLEPEVAARESLLMGRHAIRQVVFDPLLPAPMVDVEARHAFVETVRAYDRAGQAIWRQVREPLRCLPPRV